MRSATPIRFFLLLSSALLLSACASVPAEKPTEALATAQHAITLANREVAQDTQSVPLYKAEQKLAHARSLLSQPNTTRQDYLKARRLAEEAALDARLAQARAEARQAQARQAALEETIETLRKALQSEEAE